MTARARIPQDDLDRVMKSVARAGIRAGRVVVDFARERVEIIMADGPPDSDSGNPWNEE